MGRLYAPPSAGPGSSSGRLYAGQSPAPQPYSLRADLKQGILGPLVQRAEDISAQPGSGPFPTVDKAISQTRNVIQATNTPFSTALKYTGLPWVADKAARVVSKGAELAGKAQATALRGGLPKPVTRKIESFARSITDPNSKANRIARSYAEETFDPATTNALGLVKDVGELAGNVVGTRQALRSLPSAATEVKDAAVKTFIEPRRATAIDKLEADYSRWTGQTKPGVKSLNRSEAKVEALNRAGTSGKTPQRVLAEAKIIPETEGTKFRTAEQAKTFRESLAPLRSAERAAVREAERSTARVKLSNLEEEAVRNVRTADNVAVGKANKLESQIRSEFADYRANYGDEIPLSIVDDIKSARWGDTKFDFTQPLKSDVNYAIAKAAQKTVERVAEQAGYPDLAQLNREIGSRLEAAKFLESLDGQTLKYGKIGKYAFIGIGASLGKGLVGKLLGAFGGEMLADFLMRADVAGPVKRIVLRSLQEESPEAYKATIKWLNGRGLLREQLLLGPGDPSRSGPQIELRPPTHIDPRAAQVNYRNSQPTPSLRPNPTFNQKATKLPTLDLKPRGKKTLDLRPKK